MMEVGLQAGWLSWVTLCLKRKPESQNKEKNWDQSSLWAFEQVNLMDE